MRTCSQCGEDDREISQGPEEEPEHFVKPEIRWAPAGMTAAGKRRFEKGGWEARTFQGREAFERMTCVDCLRNNEDRDRTWEAMRKQARELETPPAQAMGGYYLTLVEE